VSGPYVGAAFRRPIPDLFRDATGFDLHELAGAALAGEIPIPEGLANRLIAERLRASGGPVSELRVHPLAGDAFEADLSIPAMRLLPTLQIHARIEQQPTPADPVLRLRWSMPSLGALASFAGSALAFFKSLPPGIRIDGDRLAVDIREVAASRGLSELLNYVTDLQLHTRPGVFLLGLGLKVSPPVNTARPATGTAPPADSPNS
jgi:hypothetical protein